MESPTKRTLGPDRSLVFDLAEQARLRGDSPAIFYYGAEINYAELWEQVQHLASHLKLRQGIVAGDRVAIDLQNSPHYIIAYYAVLLAGGIVVPLNPMYRAEEVGIILKNSDAKIIVAAENLLDRFTGWEGSGSLHIIVARYASMLPQSTPCSLPEEMTCAAIDIDNDPRLTAWDTALETPITESLTYTEIDIDAPAVMPYTSGSTGIPKGCLHTHRSVKHTAVAQVDWYNLSPQSVITAVQPLFHVAGMQGSMNAAIYVGASLLVLTRWDADAAITMFARHGVTFWNAPPTMVVDMMSRGSKVDAALKHVTIVTGGGSAMPEAVAARLKTEYQLDYIEGYGMSETMSPTHLNPMSAPRPGMIGITIQDTRALIIDPETFTPLPDGEVGEIAVSGPQIMLGYWANPEADAETFFEHQGQRFLRTGDLGLRESDGYFRLVDRLKRMINASGFKVWPTEIESVIYAHDAVQSCCVIASPDPYRGESVKALVQLRPGAELSAPALTTWLRERMAAFKVPRTIEFVGDLPLTATHKVNWRQLQEREKSSAAANT